MFFFCDESEEDLREMVGSFVEMCSRIGLKFKGVRRKLTMLGGEEGLEREIRNSGCNVCVRI